MEFADLQKFNGTVTDSSYTTAQTVADIYNTLVMSRLSDATQFEKAPADFTAEWKDAQQQDLLPVGGVFYQYARFSSMVIESAKSTGYPQLLMIDGNNNLEDKYINGEWQNPYEISKVFAMAPAGNSISKLSFSVVFPNNIFLSNDNESIQSMEFRIADDRPFQPITFNQPVSVSYALAGTYRWTFRITLTTGKVLLSHSKFEVDTDLESFYSNQSVATKSSDLAQYQKHLIDPYYTRPTYPWQQPVEMGKATLYIKLASNHQQITKPLIVSEGFDVGYYISPYKEGGINNIQNFIDDMKRFTSLSSYINSDYDIIYVDWGNGTDYIQNNAELLKKAIRWVNQQKAANGSNEPNVVLGQSMGGLVARWALKDMEDKGENHDTKLYISHDSPHLGANIPIGLQQMITSVYHLYIKSPGIAGLGQFVVPLFNNGISGSDILTLTGSPAARQMLINYVNDNYQVDNSIHNDWQNQLKLKGYPQRTRNVAISNGSECGVNQSPDDILRMQKETNNAHYFSDVIGSILGGFLGRFDLITLSSLPGSSKYTFDIAVRPMNQLNENKQLYYADIKYKKKILWLINSQVTLLNKSAYQPSGILPIDRYSGSVYNFDDDKLPNFLKDGLTINNFGFIPTASSLDYKRGNTALSEVDYTKTFSPSDDASTVPFTNWVVEPNSFDARHTHIAFSNRNGQFIISQLTGSNQDEKISTAYLCANTTQISGENILCTSSSATYAIGFAPNIQWHVLNGSDLIDIKSPMNQSQITLTPKAGANGLVELQVYLYGDGESNTVSKTIWIGTPKIQITPGPDNTNYATFYAESAVPGVSLQDMGLTPQAIVWKRLDTGATKTGYSYTGRGNSYNWSFDVDVTATNSCGTYTQRATIAPPPPPACDTYKIAKVAGNQYTIARIIDPTCPTSIQNKSAQSSTEKNSETYKITVANSLGKIIISKDSKDFDLANFPTGIYYVKVEKENRILVSQALLK